MSGLDPSRSWDTPVWSGNRARISSNHRDSSGEARCGDKIKDDSRRAVDRSRSLWEVRSCACGSFRAGIGVSSPLPWLASEDEEDELMSSSSSSELSSSSIKAFELLLAR